MAEKRKEIIAWAAFIVYFEIAFYFLIIRNMDIAYLAECYGSFGKWGEEVLWNLDVVPFRFGYQHYGYSMINWTSHIIGNIALFVPAGILLPCLFPKMRAWGIWKFAAVMAGAISVVELSQLLLMCGYGDINDLILNLFGACIGFAGLKAARRWNGTENGKCIHC